MTSKFSDSVWRQLYENARSCYLKFEDENAVLAARLTDAKQSITELNYLVECVKGGVLMPYTVGDFNIGFDSTCHIEYSFVRDGETFGFSKDDLPADAYDWRIRSVKIVPEISGEDLTTCLRCYFDINW